MKLAPEKIYLNDPVEAFQDDSMNPFDYVTWSEDPVHENDVEYIRKDLVNTNSLLTEVQADIQRMIDAASETFRYNDSMGIVSKLKNIEDKLKKSKLVIENEK